MRARVSIIVPVLNSEAELPRLLPGLMEGVEAGLIRELILSDGGSSDATAEIAEEVGALWVTGPPTRGGQLARGAASAGGDWLMFLHADSQLPRGWSEAVLAQMADGRPGYARLAFDAGGLSARIVAGWANLRARLFALPYGDQGLLIARSDYDAVGGYPDIPLMEDVAMARALGRRLRQMPFTIRTGAGRYLRDGWLRRGARNLSLLLRYLGGADPEALRRRY
ncbi:transferase 2, rSAM/selenodomain-associated [Roseovarius nanhaiticus]|uniref:Transferase 2, rSAM/selenodomain-associated n=1 Tax=Roseovarius nanhaiticus TaxID=573024 RepID=A0A1N7ERN7_9RHOB|nr:TIGR04283 family arsenosugar biosynthesis glycosyltransferase [Roseovarius nanhaiticus]SEK68031.1 transferase 2, rSAM/selenodomain-associated [Roseovarius nanhaiticus]SIR90736.1 transferase 2, rSAM/selenodomain-associated [Roseovarius nanhaiticus]